MRNLLMKSLKSPVISMLALSVMVFPLPVIAGDTISDPTGGLLKAVQIAENMEPSIIHPGQEEPASN